MSCLDHLQEKVEEQSRQITTLLAMIGPFVRGKKVRGRWRNPNNRWDEATVEGVVTGVTAQGLLVRNSLESPVEIYLEDIYEIH